MVDVNLFKQFLVEARQASSSNNKKKVSPSRPHSKDSTFKKYDYYYLDSQIGNHNFIGEEVVWKDEKAYWGMNYIGKQLTDDIPQGFSDFLKKALSKITVEAPYRGPEKFQEDNFLYECSWDGEIDNFNGEEVVSFNGSPIFKLQFHGGTLL